MIHYAYRSPGAIIHAAMGKASSAGGGDLYPVHRAFVAGYRQYANHVAVLIASKRHGYPLVYYRPLLIYAAAEHGFALRYYLGGDVHYPLRRELIIIGQLRHFPKHIVFHLLNEGIKQQRHIISPFECKTS